MVKMIERCMPFVAYANQDSGRSVSLMPIYARQDHDEEQRGNPETGDQKVVDLGLGLAGEPLQHPEEEAPDKKKPGRASQDGEDG